MKQLQFRKRHHGKAVSSELGCSALCNVETNSLTDEKQSSKNADSMCPSWIALIEFAPRDGIVFQKRN